METLSPLRENDWVKFNTNIKFVASVTTILN